MPMSWPIIGVGSIVSASGSFLGYKWLRPKFPATVNCWFCNKDQKVRFPDRNNFTCVFCDQYNGFTEDGDYNKDIGQSSDEFRQPTLRFAMFNGGGSPRSSSNGLCQSCNLNQSLKVHQLSKFVPLDPNSYDEEVRAFSAHLEKAYRLCRTCEAILHQTLGEQDSKIRAKLLSWKLQMNRQSALNAARSIQKAVFRNVPLAWRTILFCLAMCIFMISSEVQLQEYTKGYDNENETISRLIANFTEELDETLQLIHGSLGLMCVVMSSLLILLISYLQTPYILQTMCHKLNLASWVITFLVNAASHFKFISSDYVPHTAFICVLTSLLSMISPFKEKAKVSNQRKSPSPTPKYHLESNGFINRDLSEKDETLTQDLLSDHSSCPSPSPSLSKGSIIRPPSLIPDERAFALPDHEIHTSNNHCDISTLNLGIPVTKPSDDTSPFTKKQYRSLNESGINFGGGRSHHRPLIKPPTFRRKNQTSWVAGGYWQKESDSRSSSQSSGFVSYSGHDAIPFGSLPNSRPPSQLGERHSVLSAPAYAPNTSFNLTGINDQLAFFDTSRVSKGRRRIEDSDDDSFDRLTQEAFSNFTPKAKSSPVPEATQTPKSFLDKQISISVSVYFVLMAFSLGCNLILLTYFVYNLAF